MTSDDRKELGAEAFFNKRPEPTVEQPADWILLQSSILNEMHDAVITVDMRGIITDCNRAAQTVFGWTREELTGRSITTFYSDEDKAVFFEQITPAVMQTGLFRGEVRNKTHSGDYIFIHLAVTLLRDSEGKPAGMVGFSVDVTGQKLGVLAMSRNVELEQERYVRQESSATMQMLMKAVDKAEDVFLITEAEPVEGAGPRILYVNPAFERMTGYTATEVIGRTPRILQGPKTDRAALDRVHNALKAWKPVREAMINYRKDGTEFYVELSIVPLANESGWYTHWFAIQRDMTEQYVFRQTIEENDRKLREREEDLTEAHRIANLGTWHWDVVTDTVTWSKEIYQMFERNPMLPPPSLEEQQQIFMPESWKRLQAAVRKAQEKGKAYEVDLELRLPSGTKKWATARGEVQTMVDGKVTRLRGTLQDTTERKQTEEKLSHAYQTLERVLTSMTDGLLVLDTEWRFTYLNEQAERLLGMTTAQLIGYCIWEVFPHFERSVFYDRYHESMMTGKPVNFEEYYPEPLNKWLECHCYPSEEGISVYFRDITERKQYESRLIEKRERLSLGMEVAALALAEVDYATGMNHMSAEAARMFGLAQSAVAVPRRAVHSTFHPDDREELARRIEGCLDPQGPGWFAMDHRVVWPSGETRWLRVRKKVFFEGEGVQRRPRRAMLAAFDVTVEKHASEEIRKSEHRFRTMAESLPQLVFTADGAGRKLYCNQRYLTYAGVESPEVMDLHWSQILHPDDREGTVATWERSLATGEPYFKEYRLRRNDGEYRYFIARAVPVKNEEGQVERWLGSLTDVHDQKMSEEVLRRSEMVAAAGRLAASVAHEINNPLESVTNLLYLLRTNQSLDAEGKRYLAVAEEELARVGEIATQTLRFHKQSTLAAATMIPDLLESILALYRSRIEGGGLSLFREYEQTEPLICRAGDVRQALANLVGNAIEATPHGGKLRVRVRTVLDWRTRAKKGVRITVGDSGRGIEPESRARIFEAFYSTKGVTNTGLGLWITKDLVARCGGTLRLRSTVRRGRSGTVFSIQLPFDAAAV